MSHLLPPLMYRLTDALRVKRSHGIFWTLTFTPQVSRTGPRLDAQNRIVTIPEARYESLKTHGPNFTDEEIVAMEEPKPHRRPRT